MAIFDILTHREASPKLVELRTGTTSDGRSVDVLAGPDPYGWYAIKDKQGFLSCIHPNHLTINTPPLLYCNEIKIRELYQDLQTLLGPILAGEVTTAIEECTETDTQAITILQAVCKVAYSYISLGTNLETREQQIMALCNLVGVDCEEKLEDAIIELVTFRDDNWTVGQFRGGKL